MKIEFNKYQDAIPFDSSKQNLPAAKGQINISATINIDIDTGKITIFDDKKRIEFSFNSPALAKKWSDATR